MKPVFKNGALSVDLHKPEVALLEKARELGEALNALVPIMENRPMRN